MTLRAPFLLGLLMTGGLLAVLPAATVTMPVEELRPGMRGTGLTVFQGTERSEFGVEIIGVLENAQGPRRNLILARLSGGPLGESGVFQGMSGSPVYVDDRLVGAVSYAMGSFPKDTIAGITPIGEMLRDDTSGAQSGATPVSTPPLSLPLDTETLTRLLPRRLAPPDPFAERPGDVRSIGLPAVEGGAVGVALRPIATPLILGGFTPEAFARIAPQFRAAGMVATAGGALMTQEIGTGTLEPGDAVGVSLMSGDLSMAGTGTVTLVDEGRVYAFGHPFYSLGPSSFPMTRAFVHTVLPSQAISSRLAAVGEVLGTIDQDRATGISGRLGPGPRLVPVQVKLRAPDRDRVDRFDFEVVADDLFTPLLSYNVMLNTLFSHSREVGGATYVVEGRVELAGHETATFEETFAGDSATVLAALYVSGPVTALVNNGFEPVQVERLEFEITAYDDVRSAQLERVWLDDPRPRPGQQVPVRIAVRTRQGEQITRTVMVDLPSGVGGRLELQVSDGASLAQRERQLSGAGLRASDLPQLITALNEARSNSRIYVQLVRPDEGAVLNGRRLAALPSSVLDVLGGDQRGGNFSRLSDAVVREWSLALDHVVSGSRTVALDLNAR